MDSKRAMSDEKASEIWGKAVCALRADSDPEAAATVIQSAFAERDAKLREALEPIWHWYQSDEHEPRPLHEIVADMVADLQTDRAFFLAQEQRDADAERYRWLRDKSCPPHNFYISVPDEFAGVKYKRHEVDAYIDKARAALGVQPNAG